MKALAAVLLLLAGAESGRVLAQTTDKEWTDAYRPGNGVTLPRLVQDVKPRYTEAAMRAKVQGTVWVDCVVEIDGTVRRTRVTRSLDRQFGLDEEAVAAARQWRFEAGRKDGTPVAVVVTIELKFALRDQEPAALSLPAAFPAGAGPTTADITWKNDVVGIPTLEVGVSYPNDWSKTDRPNMLLAVMANDTSRGVFIANPVSSTLPELAPASLAILQEMGMRASNAYKRPLVAAGQARIANRLWIWCDLGPLETAARDNLWLFTTITEGHEVAVAFTSVQSGSAGADRDADAQNAGRVFALILERLVFTRRN